MASPQPPAQHPAPAKPVNPPAGIAIRALAAATDRLLATVDTLTADEFAEPSILPGWSRAHVLAHLALNAKGLAGVLTTVGEPDPLSMYASNARRDSDIDDLAVEAPARIAERLAIGSAVLAAHLGAGPTPEESLEMVGTAATPQARGEATRPAPVGAFARAADEAAEAVDTWSVSGTFERVPGATPAAAAEIPYMRWREVEIHHADLDLGYAPDAWSAEFAEYLLAVSAYDRDGEAGMTLFPEGRDPLALSGPGSESGRESGGAEIHGSAAALAWWLVGRGAGEGLTVHGGELPALGPWVRR